MSSFQNVIECAGGAVLQLLWRSDQRDVLDADDVLVELRALAQHAGGARLVLMHPGAVRMAPTAQIRASLERAGVVCNDESLIFASILDETITALRFGQFVAVMAPVVLTQS